MGSLAADPIQSSHRVRLHITPFNPSLLDRIIAPSIQAEASHISFHTVQTFPERGFGYVEMPVMEAQRLKKKLNGSTLKGAKVRVEDAKPEKKRRSDAGDDDGGSKTRKKAKTEKPRREDGVIPGHELEASRRVKRGWTDDNLTSKKKHQSKAESQDNGVGLEGKKLRFKTNLTVHDNAVESKNKDENKEKKGKDGKKGKKKVVVEEFARTQKSPATPSIVGTDSRGALTYEDGKGWIDEAGNVIEAERTSRRRRHKKESQEIEPRISAVESRELVDEIPSQTRADSSDLVEDEDMASDDPAAKNKDEADLSNVTDDEGGQNMENSEPARSVHPLEELFKRPTTSPTDSAKRRPKPIDTSFSFFDTGAANVDNEDEDTGLPPQTPHTKRDMEWRSIRSAAPTPDTAAIGRSFLPEASSDEDEEENAEEEHPTKDVQMEDAKVGSNGAQSSGQERGEESTFRKWFYENRGDLNRGWKKRRREERKHKRQRENRRLSRKVA